MDSPDSFDEESQLVQDYLVLFMTLAKTDVADYMLFHYPMNKLTSEHGNDVAFAVYNGLALVALRRLDFTTMMVDPEPLAITTLLQAPDLSLRTPGELSESESWTARGVQAATEFLGHVAANDTSAAFVVLNDLYTTQHYVDNEGPCSCQLLRFAAVLSHAALSGPTSEEEIHRHRR